MSYGDVHRYLLRTIASRGVVTIVEANNILQTQTGNGDKNIEDFIKEINNQIKPFKQTIKMVNDEFTAEKKLVFLTLTLDDTTKSQNVFTPSELQYFRMLLEQIMTTESRQITSIQALNLVSKLSISKSKAQYLLDTWCRMYYLDHINSNYALGVRAIHEFQNYLRENMPDAIEDCTLCKQIVFRGYNCPACYKAIHTLCLNRYLETVKKWPCCKVEYNESQVERLVNGRLTQTQKVDETQALLSQVSINNESVESSDDEFESTQQTIQGISQGASRKRKRKAN